MNLEPDVIRHSLYPLGFIASSLFGLRFVWQWFRSEQAGRSLVDTQFWKLSLVANGLMGLHYFIQIHFTLFLLQCLNAFLAWRNLRLFKKGRQLEKSERVIAIFLIIATSAALFLLQSWLLLGVVDWVRSPYAELQPHPISLGWHCFGTIAACIFSSRFWMQWWSAENEGRSYLKPWFWWLSLTGSMMMSLYAYEMYDPVTFFANTLPLIGYLRNLLLLRKESRTQESKTQR